ncbi:unnamed protein product [Litomosoides sigmodontis]|uniref:Uncharacterized protein n=1 Tax=Litomosoides sigmodontis TaxID=42156 RepID=A0A3P6T066_LITSI|nr:unnamed protein product [Litomosoides sigmodontis]
MSGSWDFTVGEVTEKDIMKGIAKEDKRIIHNRCDTAISSGKCCSCRITFHHSYPILYDVTLELNMSLKEQDETFWR